MHEQKRPARGGSVGAGLRSGATHARVSKRDGKADYDYEHEHEHEKAQSESESGAVN